GVHSLHTGRGRSGDIRPAGCPARHAGIAHGRHRPANSRICRRYQFIPICLRDLVGKKEHRKAGGGCYCQESDTSAPAGHFLPPLTWPGGTSSISFNSATSTFFASPGALNWNASAATAASVAKSLIRSVYCGAPVKLLLVITYLRGIGRGPTSTQ